MTGCQKSEHFLRVAGKRLRIQRIRPGASNRETLLPTLVFLHEGLGCIEMWRDIPGVLAAETGLPALVYDRQGHGKSEPLRLPRPLTAFHDEAFETLPELLRHQAIGQAILVGHSDGGSIALLFAAEFPEKTAGVITEAAHVFVEEATLEGVREAVRNFREANLKSRLSRYHGEKTDSVFRAWSETWLDPGFRDWNIESYLGRITAPLLVIQGAEDEYATAAQVEAIAAGVSGPVETRLLPGAGHVPHFQAREKVLSLMTRFIRSLI